MKFRWTIKELKERTDDEIVRGIIAERLGDLNPYAPLAVRLQNLYNKFDKQIKGEGVEKVLTLRESAQQLLDRLAQYGTIDHVREEGAIEDLKNALSAFNNPKETT